MTKQRFEHLNASLLERIVKDNSGFIPDLEARLTYMNVYRMVEWRNRNEDPFTIEAPNCAVGYSIKKVRGRFVVEPHAWLIKDGEKLHGIHNGKREDGVIYIGVPVPERIRKKYGTHAFNYVLGSLDAIKNSVGPRGFQ